jgi:DNA-binding transcriptional ArsR family regulator
MPDPNVKRILWYLFVGSRGGINRVKIIDLLKEHPYNINQLAEALNLDYKAIQHHISVLEKNNIVSKMGEKYGVLYFISNYLEANIEALNEIRSKMNEKYVDKGLVIVGVHAPEFEFEKNIDNVKEAVKKFGIKYPVIRDNDKGTWNAYENQYWPQKYIVDHEGYIRYDHIGEGGYSETEEVIQSLL